MKSTFSSTSIRNKKCNRETAYMINLILCFRFDALTELRAFMRTFFLCISLLRVASGPRVKVAGRKSALNPPTVYSTDRSKAVVPVLVLLLVALWAAPCDCGTP